MTHTGVQRTPGNRRKARTTLTAAAILTALAVTAFLACGTGDLDRESAGTPVVTTQTPQQQEPTAPQPTQDTHHRAGTDRRRANRPRIADN